MSQLGVTVAPEDARSILHLTNMSSGNKYGASNGGDNVDAGNFIEAVMSDKEVQREGGLVGVRFQSEVVQPDDPILDPYGNRLRTKFVGGKRSKLPRRYWTSLSLDTHMHAQCYSIHIVSLSFISLTLPL